jgi:hypothetical protein
MLSVNQNKKLKMTQDTLQSLEQKAEMSYVLRRRGLGKIANAIRDKSGIVLGNMIQLGNESPKVFDTPVPVLELPVQAKQATEDRIPFMAPRAISAHRQVMLDKKASMELGSVPETTRATGEIPKKTSVTAMSDVAPGRVGLQRREKGSTDLSQFGAGSSSETRTPDQPLETVEIRTDRKPVVMGGLQKSAAVDIATMQLPPKTLVETASQDIASLPITPEASAQGAPLGDHLEKKYNIMELRQKALEEAQDSFAKTAANNDVAGALSLAYYSSQDPNMLPH